LRAGSVPAMEAREPTELRGGRAPSPDELESWIGWRVDDLNGSMLGHVESVIGDGEGGVAWLVIAEFRLGDESRYLVPAYDAVGGAGRVWSPHPREQVWSSARLSSGAGFTPQADRSLRAHYAAPQRHVA
jgi:hypothetical protein